MNSIAMELRQVSLKGLLSVMGVVFLFGCGSTPMSQSRPASATEKARMLVEAANGAILEGDPSGALAHLADAEELDPRLPELYHSRALALYSKGDLQSALTSAKRSIELMPNYSEANNTLGKILLDLGRYRESEGPLLKAASDSLNPEAFKARTNLGMAHYKQGNFEKARQNFDLAIQDNPAQACVAYYYKGHLELQQSHFSEAVTNYDKATKHFCGTFTDAHLALGIAYARNKQFDLARKKFLDLQKIYPGTPVAEKAAERLRYLP